MDTEALPRCQANDLNAVCVFWTLFELVDQLGHLAVRSCAENNLLQFWLCLSRFSNFSELFPLFLFIRVVSNAKLPLLDSPLDQLHVLTSDLTVDSLLLRCFLLLNYSLRRRSKLIEPVIRLRLRVFSEHIGEQSAQ